MAPGPSRFNPQRVPLGDWRSILREAYARIALAPFRLLGLYLLVYLPLQFIDGSAYVAMPLRAAAMSLAFSGLYVAIDRAQSGELPGLREMFLPWHMPWSKVLLLAASGAATTLLTWAVWYLDAGQDTLGNLLSMSLTGSDDAVGAASGVIASASDPGARLRLESALVDNALGIPLLFLQPVCVRYDWSGSRSLAANLVVSLRNFEWGLVFAVVLVPLTMMLYLAPTGSVPEILVLMAVDLVIGLYASAVCLVVLDRSLGNPSGTRPLGRQSGNEKEPGE